MWIVGLDVGGTKIEGVLFHRRTGADPLLAQGEPVRLPTHRDQGAPWICAQMVQVIRTLCDRQGLNVNQLKALGIGLPGTVDPDTKRMEKGNTVVLQGVPVDSLLQTHLGRPDLVVEVENDANCFALAEVCQGVGWAFAEQTGVPVDQQIGVGVILGTGCGAGLVMKGEIFRGARGGASEWGHTLLESNGYSCYCGKKGCAEQYISGSALEAAYGARRTSQALELLSASAIFERACQGDPLALACVKDYQDKLARFCGNLITALNPHYIVLGGGVSQQAILYEGLEARAQEFSFLSHQTTPIWKHKLGNASGTLGAAWVASTKLLQIHSLPKVY